MLAQMREEAANIRSIV